MFASQQELCSLYGTSMAFIAAPCGRSLRPVKNEGKVLIRL